MQDNKHFLNYPAADEPYTSGAFEGSTGQVDVSSAKRRLVWLYIFNKSGATIYARLGAAQGDNDQASAGRVPFPVGAGQFLSVVYGGGRRVEAGIRVMLFTDAACTAALATDSVWVDAGFTAYA